MPLSGLAVSAAAALLLAAAAPAARAGEARTVEVLCGDHEDLVSTAREEYGERRAWWGIVGEGDWVAELHLAPGTGSWTFIRVDPSGTACVLAGGNASASEGDLP